jgi:hypothetical protein
MSTPPTDVLTRLDSIIEQMDTVTNQLRLMNEYCARLTVLVEHALAKGEDIFDDEDSE